MNHYVIAASCVFSALFTIWQRHTWLNVSIKLALFGMSIWGWYLVFRGGLI